MLLNQRQQQIYDILKREKSITTRQLLEILFVSEATLRRDLNVLEKNGIAHRTHGGAVLTESAGTESSILLRIKEQTKEKQNIALTCLPLINDNDTIFVDSSSTVGYLLPLLSNFKNITILTNGLNNAAILTQNTDLRVYITSGNIYRNTNSVLGIDTVRYIENFHANVFIFSCSGLSIKEGIMEASFEQALVKRVMLDHSKIHILLVDYTKFGKIFMTETTSYDNIDYIITDRIPSQEYIDFFESKHIKLLVSN